METRPREDDIEFKTKAVYTRRPKQKKGRRDEVKAEVDGAKYCDYWTGSVFRNLKSLLGYCIVDSLTVSQPSSARCDWSCNQSSGVGLIPGMTACLDRAE